MRRATENWLRIAKAELKAAQSLFNDSNHIKSTEHCHAALEKILKAIITENEQVPAKIHDLLKLASIAIIENLQIEVQDLLDELNDIFMATRYPDEFLEIEAKITQEKNLDLLEKTKETFKWLEKKIK